MDLVGLLSKLIHPSGVLFDRSTEKERQPYMFGGKELVSMHGLNEYDFTGRW